MTFAIISLIIKTLSNLISLAKDIQNTFASINPSKDNRSVALKQFIRCIQMHSKAKQLSKRRYNIDSKSLKNSLFNFQLKVTDWIEIIKYQYDPNSRLANDFLETYQYVIMAIFIFTILSICVTLLLIQFEMVELILYFYWVILYRFGKWFVKLLFQANDSTNLSLLVNYAIQIVATYGVIFLICELGERVSNEFIQVDNVVGQLKWYLFPTNIQKILPIVMIGTQEPVIFWGYGNFVSSREAFKNVSSKLIT